MKKFAFPLQPVLNWRDHLHTADRTHLQTLLTEQAKVKGEDDRLGEATRHELIKSRSALV